MDLPMCKEGCGRCQQERDDYEKYLFILSKIHITGSEIPNVLCTAPMKDFNNNHSSFPKYPEYQRKLMKIAYINNMVEGLAYWDRSGLLGWVEEKYWGDLLLIERFESQIVFDCHGFVLKFERSGARKELYKRGRKVLTPIINHLRRSIPDDKFDLQRAWGMLLSHIQFDIDPEKSGPKKLKDTEGWIKWAERFALKF